jgi:magnesium chelatase subunit D
VATLPTFPFSAIVGQEEFKRALILGAINPSIGGVLIRGTKGVAKSTAVRALARLLPQLKTIDGCPFQRQLDELIVDWPLPADAPPIERSVPLIELPLGATEDRLLGALHLERALRGERVFEPGLLAAANRGLLYVDEVNLLPDHLVDLLLDVAASGWHQFEREGLSIRHPARFSLIGTMNPEEGELRPQLLDRFGLVADAGDLTEPGQRAEATRRRLAFEADPAAFVTSWRSADDAEAQRIARAQSLFSSVRVPDAVLSVVSQRCLAEGVEGLRADLTICRAATAWAAYQGRDEVTPADVDVVAELALAHRRTHRPRPQPPHDDGPAPGNDRESSPPRDESNGAMSGRFGERVFESEPRTGPRSLPKSSSTESPVTARGRQQQVPGQGPASGYLRPWSADLAHTATISWAATLRQAAKSERQRIEVADLRLHPRRAVAGCLLLFVVDASGSMGAWQRMRRTKAGILALLDQAGRKRDTFALVACRGQGAEVALPPSRSMALARQVVERLPVGGPTPLAHGLAMASQLASIQRRRCPGRPIQIVVFTDGRANVPLADTSDPWTDALAAAQHCAGDLTLVVDTQAGWTRLERPAELARALGADCLPLDDLLGRQRTAS